MLSIIPALSGALLESLTSSLREYYSLFDISQLSSLTTMLSYHRTVSNVWDGDGKGALYKYRVCRQIKILPPVIDRIYLITST